MISSAASMEGELRLEQLCSEPQTTAAGELPPVQVTSEVPEGIRLTAPLHLAWSDVLTALHTSLEGKVPVRRLSVQGARIAQQPRVVLELELDDDPCGPVWLAAEPWFNATENAIRLRNVEVVPGWKPGRKLGELPAQLERHCRIELPIELADLRQRLDRTRAGLVPHLDEVEVEITLGAPTVKTVALDAQGLVPMVTVAGAAAVRAESR